MSNKEQRKGTHLAHTAARLAAFKQSQTLKEASVEAIGDLKDEILASQHLAV